VGDFWDPSRRGSIVFVAGYRIVLGKIGFGRNLSQKLSLPAGNAVYALDHSTSSRDGSRPMKFVLRATVAMAAVALLVPLLGGGAAATPAVTGPDGGAAGAQWAATHDGPQQYPHIPLTGDVAITMSDGAVVEAAGYRPADTAARPLDALHQAGIQPRRPYGVGPGSVRCREPAGPRYRYDRDPAVRAHRSHQGTRWRCDAELRRGPAAGEERLCAGRGGCPGYRVFPGC